jgi:plastocyanin
MPRVMGTRHLAGVGVLLLLTMGAACSRQDAPARTPPPGAKRVDAGTAGTVGGRVTVEGTLPPNAPLKLEGDPACQQAHKDGASSDTYVGENGGLGNVFVYVKDGLGQYYFDVPGEPVELDQRGCIYKPHVFGVRVGQNIEFVNSDATGHNVHALPKANREFNFSQQIQTQKDRRSFTAPEVMVRFKCDIHGWMSAYAGVLDHPYFAVTGPGGAFELQHVPPGTYTIEAWHERLGTQTQQVTLTEKGSAQVTFTFKAPAATQP